MSVRSSASNYEPFRSFTQFFIHSGRWHQFKIHARWTRSKDGFINIYYEDKLVAQRARTKTILYDSVRVKYGIYRMPSGEIYDPSYIPPTHTVYFKNVKAAKSENELSY